MLANGSVGVSVKVELLLCPHASCGDVGDDFGVVGVELFDGHEVGGDVDLWRVV